MTFYTLNNNKTNTMQNNQNKIANLDNEIAKLLKLKQQYQDIENKSNSTQPINNLWASINNELVNLEPNITKAIIDNQDYQKTNTEINAIVQQELLLLVQDKVASREDGKALLEKQLEIIKSIKAGTTKQQQEDLLMFAKFKEYVKLHPETTWEQFLTKTQ